MKEVALALGGGGYKGIAHLGVIRAIEEMGYKIGAIAGTSIGGLIGAVYCSGLNTYEIEQIVEKLDSKTFYNRGLTEGPGLLGLNGVSKLLLDTIGEITFDELKLPLACTAVDVNSGYEYILNTGKVKDAVLATIAIPGVFPPLESGELSLVDGGVLDPVPVKLARWMAPTLPVIAVCLHPVPEEWKTIPNNYLPAQSGITGKLLEQVSKLRISQAMNIFMRSYDTTYRMLAEARMAIEKPELILRPNVAKFSVLELVPPHDLIQEGLAIACAHKDKIKNFFNLPSRLSRVLSPTEHPGVIYTPDAPAPDVDADAEPEP